MTPRANTHPKRKKATPVSRIGKTVKYRLQLMPRLGRDVNDGSFRIDNNVVENAVRPLALGRILQE